MLPPINAVSPAGNTSTVRLGGSSRLEGPNRGRRGLFPRLAPALLYGGPFMFRRRDFTTGTLLPMNRIGKLFRRLARRVDGAVFVEYLLLLTLVGIGVIAGLAAVRGAMLSELQDLTDAIKAISS